MTSPLTPRVNNIETGGVWKIGDVKHSFLSEAQFQAEHDDTWILCDGRSIAGSDLETVTGWTTVPDARGQFLRGKNNGRADGNQNPDGDLALGQFQNAQFQSHDHGGGDHQHNTVNTNQISTNGGAFTSGTNADYGQQVSAFPTQFSGNVIASEGGNETRPKNVTVNMFIKINREPST